MKFQLTFWLILLCSIFHGQTVLGKWQTIDDETGLKKSIVEIYEMNGKLYGKVIQLFRKPDEDPNPTCEKCDDDRKDQPVIGMNVMRDMILQDGYYKSGTICDPNNGKVYRCEMWLSSADSNKLELRGYWGLLYRTQTWIRL